MCPAVRIDFGYHGARFFGSQRQNGVRTVQSELEDAITKLTGTPGSVQLAGRTDRGVHAVGQVATGTVSWPKDLERLRFALDSVTDDDLIVYRVSEIEDGFHARFSARRREYRYRIWNAPMAPVLSGDIVWWIRKPLDIDVMNEASSTLTGNHDFRSFTGKGFGSGTATRKTTRMVVDAGWDQFSETLEPRGRLMEFRIIADSFLPHMVRNIVGALTEVGAGRKSADWIVELRECRNRTHAPAPAPPHGLVLWNIEYENEEHAESKAGAGAREEQE